MTLKKNQKFWWKAIKVLNSKINLLPYKVYFPSSLGKTLINIAN
jgi:hypothetical protein